jgi:hypothetical protein
MNSSHRFDRVLRWYPPNWRQKYGDGLTALLEDSYGENPLPLGIRISLARTGTVERAREVGVLGRTAPSSEQLKAGSLLVLCGWSLFVVAGATFAKFTEHWSVAMGSSHRTLPTIADTATQLAGMIGAVAVLLAAVFVTPTFVRHLRAEGWASVRRPMTRAFVAVMTTAVGAAGVILWAHHLNVNQRNGGSALFGYGVVLAAIVAVAALAVVTSTVITVTRSLDLPRRTLRTLSSTALGLTLLMCVVASGVGLWWASEAAYDPRFLANGIGSDVLFTSNTLPPPLVFAGVFMTVGLLSALCGSARVIGGFKRA